VKQESLTPKGQRRLEELLQAAKVVFESAGYFDTRVSDIVSKAGVSHGTFYIYFDSKDDILRTLIERMVDEIFRASEIPLDPRLSGSSELSASPQLCASPQLSAYRQLEASIRQYMVEYRRQAPMLRILEQAVASSDEFLRIRLAIRERFLSRIQTSIESRQRRGLCDPALDPFHTAHALGGMVDYLAHALYVQSQPLDEDEAVASMTRVWAQTVGIRCQVEH
jgi:AcrR family transcriptional regulator